MVDLSLYRSNVGIMVINKNGLVLACRRSNLHQIEELNADTSWQMPQGGVNDNENIIDAAYRELEEETAIPKSSLAFIDFWDEFLTYDFDETGNLLYPEYKGQKQKWVILKYTNDNLEIQLDLASDDEFNKAKWSTLNELLEHVWAPKRHIYQALEKRYQGILAK